MKNVKTLLTILTLQSAVGLTATSAVAQSNDEKNATTKTTAIPYRTPQSEAADSNHAGPSAESLIKSSAFIDMYSSIVKQVSSGFDAFSKNMEKEIDRYRIDQKIPILSLSKSFAGVETYYQYVVEPAYVDGQHTRQDIWVIDLGTTNGLVAGTQLRFTFNRLFPTKWEAMKAKPYFPIRLDELHVDGKFPWNSKQAKELLNSGDVARLEISGRLGAGGHGFSVVDASYTREALLLIDIYKHNADTVRTRVLALKNLGHASVGLSSNFLPKWVPSPTSLLKNVFGLKASLTYDNSTLNIFSPNDEYPVDSMMVDYIYSFNAQKGAGAGNTPAEAAFDQVLNSIKKMGFIDIVNPKLSEEDLSKTLISKAQMSDDMAKADYLAWKNGKVAPQDIRVRRLFKGRLQSKIVSVDGNPKAGQLAKLDARGTSTRSFVTSDDMQDRKSYFIVDGSNSSYSRSFFFGRSSTLRKIDVDLLIQSDSDKHAVQPIDLVVQKQFRERSMSADTITEISDNLIRNLPDSLKRNPEVTGFFPRTSQKNASINYRFNFGMTFYKLLAQMDTGTLIEKLTNFLDNYPQQQNLTLPKEGSDGGNQYVNTTVAEYVVDLARKLKAMTADYPGDAHEAAAKRLEAFSNLKTDPNFENVIITDFFADLLAQNPPDDMNSEFGLTLTYSAKDAPTKVKHFGAFNTSEVYNAVTFFRDAISDRSFDLRLETVEAQTRNGRRQIEIPMNFGGADPADKD